MAAQDPATPGGTGASPGTAGATPPTNPDTLSLADLGFEGVRPARALVPDYGDHTPSPIGARPARAVVEPAAAARPRRTMLVVIGLALLIPLIGLVVGLMSPKPSAPVPAVTSQSPAMTTAGLTTPAGRATPSASPSRATATPTPSSPTPTPTEPAPTTSPEPVAAVAPPAEATAEAPVEAPVEAAQPPVVTDRAESLPIAPPPAPPAPVATMAPPPPRVFANCRKLNDVYPHGVGVAGAYDRPKGAVTNYVVDPATYAANRDLDKDGDGIACE